MGNNLKQCLEYKDAKVELLNKYKDDFDFEELGKLAIDYSDGIIEADKEVNAELLKYAEDAQKPVLRFPGDDFADAYETFYSQL